MFYLKNKKTNKYLDYKFQEVSSKKDAYGYDNINKAFKDIILENYVIVDENDNVIKEELLCL